MQVEYNRRGSYTMNKYAFAEVDVENNKNFGDYLVEINEL